MRNCKDFCCWAEKCVTANYLHVRCVQRGWLAGEVLVVESRGGGGGGTVVVAGVETVLRERLMGHLFM